MTIYSLGDLIDMLETIRLRIKVRGKKDPLSASLRFQEAELIKESNTLLTRPIKFRRFFPKGKIYNLEMNIQCDSSNEAISALKETVKQLWDLQEFINLEKYKTATKTELRKYIDDLNRLNKLRNYYIDEVNRLYAENR